MVVGVSQQDGDDLHTRRFGLPLSILQCSLHRPLTVHCILPHLTPVRGKKRYRNVNNALNNCLRTGFSYFVVFPATLERNHGSATGFRHLTLGLHCVAGTVSGTKESVVEEGTEPHTETTAASTTGRGGKRRKTLTDSESLIFYAYIFVKIRKIKQIHPLFYAFGFTILPLKCIFSIRQADLCEGVVVWCPPVGLLDKLTVHFILQLRVGQAHLQSVLGQRGVVIDRWRLNQHVDEELTGLQRRENFLIF